MTLANVVIDRRKPTTDETIQLWMNVVSAVLAVVPMLLTDLKGYLPEHYYGILSSVALAVNAGIDVYRRTRYGKIVAIEPVEGQS